MKKILVLTILFWVAVSLLGLFNEQNGASNAVPPTPRAAFALSGGGGSSITLSSDSIPASPSEDHWGKMLDSATSFLRGFALWETEALSKAVVGAPRELQAAIGFALITREALVLVGLYMLLGFGKMLGRFGG